MLITKLWVIDGESFSDSTFHKFKSRFSLRLRHTQVFIESAKIIIWIDMDKSIAEYVKK
ncbi:MAG: hypothetical protein H7Z73_01160 [Candidatus Saccharibacteria bacterium]|nr:hypothetical protein [Moraxellaceae bacterium]